MVGKRQSSIIAALVCLTAPLSGALLAQVNAGPPPPLTFRVNSTSPAALAAFDSGYSAFLDLNWGRAGVAFQRAYAADSQLRLARAFEITVRGRSPASGDAIELLRMRNGGANNLVEHLMFMYLRDWNYSRIGSPAALLNAASRVAPGDNRLLAHYHLNLALGSANRNNIARILKQREPDNYRTHAHLALTLTAAADSAEMLAAMNEALRLGPNQVLAHRVAGEVLTRRRRYEEALPHYGHALGADSTYHLAALDRAQALMYLGRWAEARRDLELVQRIATYAVDVGLARRAAALTYLHEGDVDRAISEMTRVVTQFESEPGRWRSQPGLAHQHLVAMYALKKDAAGIERHIAGQSELLGEDAGAVHFGAAIGWSLAGNPARARQELASYEKLVAENRIFPAAGVLPGLRATVLHAEGKHEEAIAAAGTSANNYAILAAYQSLTALGRQAEARERLQRLLSVNHALDVVAIPVAKVISRRAATP